MGCQGQTEGENFPLSPSLAAPLVATVYLLVNMKHSGFHNVISIKRRASLNFDFHDLTRDKFLILHHEPMKNIQVSSISNVRARLS